MLAFAADRTTVPPPLPAENPAPARTITPGWAPAVLTERGAAMCQLVAFRDAFEALSFADRAHFAEELTGLLGIACLADAALDALAGR